MSFTDDPVGGEPRVVSVSDLTGLIKGTLEEMFPSVWVAGELSNVARPQSGHVYFTLKDEKAQIRAVCWRNTAARLPFEMKDGLEVVVQGSLDVYPPRGSYQLVAKRIEPKGEGALQLALRQLQQKLSREGLFDSGHKKPLPQFPRRIAVVTSPTGAAIRDFLEVLRRRWRGATVLVIPARVQGKEAAGEIAAGIQAANQLSPAPDVLVVGRGGGSLEDLWCFNEEKVVRAIFQSDVPVVSAVGHEIDVTLSDLVADLRAATPTEAAERIVPAMVDIQAGLDQAANRLRAALKRRAAETRAHLDRLASRPVLATPVQRIHSLSQLVDDRSERLHRAMRSAHDSLGQQLSGLAGRLESLSPLGVLGRGYSVTQLTDSEEVLRDAGQVAVGDSLRTRLAKGEITSRVESISSNDEQISS